MLSADLIDRLKARAADPAARTDRYDLGSGHSHFGDAFETRRFNLDGSAMPEPEPLPAPATPEDVEAAENRLGFALPADLRQLHMSVANGGVGPGGGLASLDEIAGRYLALRAEPPGEGGQTWPKTLLPMDVTEPGADCYDLETGEIVCWDEESLADGPGDDVWAQSFRKAAGSLGAWLEDWLAKPPLSEQLAEAADEGMRENMRQTLAYWRAMTPEQRAEFGLSEDGWEEELFGHLGIDLKNL